MSGIKTLARPLFHATLGECRTSALARAAEDATVRARYRLDPSLRPSGDALRAMRDRHRDKRCFIIGNGPSLKTMNLSPLRDEYTFGLNRVYLMFEKLGFTTTYLVSINRYVIEQCAADLVAQDCQKFISWQNRDLLPDGHAAVLFQTSSHPGFSTDASATGLWEGATVTYTAMQLAYHMGFSQVILIGVDHSFTTSGPAHKLVTSSGDDPNHFDPSYFGKGFRWQLPDLETSEIAYEMARSQFEAAGRRIVDATEGGKLTIFPKASYDGLVRGRAA